MKDRLKIRASFWGKIGSPDWVLDVVYNGYRIPFIGTSPSLCLSNNKSALDTFVVNPLTVYVNSEGKRRLILELRHFNKIIVKNKFKIEDVHVFFNLQPSGYMFKFDVKSGYHH